VLALKVCKETKKVGVIVLMDYHGMSIKREITLEEEFKMKVLEKCISTLDDDELCQILIMIAKILVLTEKIYLAFMLRILIF